MNKINRLIKILNEKNIESALIFSHNNRWYLSGFKSSNGAILIIKGEAYFLVDFRYYESAKSKVKDMNIVLMENFSSTIKDLFKSKKVKSISIEYEYITLSKYDFLKSVFENLNITIKNNNILDEILKNMRIIKSLDEIEKISIAQKISEKAFLNVLNDIKPGVTEKQVEAKLEYYLKFEGAEAASFDLIVLSGKNTSLPHGVPCDKKICIGDFVTIDMGSVIDGYRSDMTRTLAVGSINYEQKKVYDKVLEAQLSAISKVKSGARCSDLDMVARKIIDNSEFKGTFGHSLGHGVGLDIHEMPYVSKNSKDILEEGMVITIEPGIYLEYKFGVRIEDMLLVKDNGYYNFTTITKDLIIL